MCEEQNNKEVGTRAKAVNRAKRFFFKYHYSVYSSILQDLEDYLIMYYTTPHSCTGKTPTELCYGRTIRSKLPCIEDIETAVSSSDYRDRDFLQKNKGKEYEDARRHAKQSDIEGGDTVLMQNLTPSNKLQTTFDRNRYCIMDA